MSIYHSFFLLIKTFNYELFFSKRTIICPSLLFSSLLFSSLLRAQDPSQFVLQTCRVMSGSSQGPDGACLPPGCFRYYYDVFITPNNSYNGNFRVKDLTVSLPLTVNGQTTISKFNKEVSEACYPNNFNGIFEVTDTEVSLLLSNDDGDPGTPDDEINIAVAGVPYRLFTAVVDAFPGEAISVQPSAVYTSVPTGGGVPPSSTIMITDNCNTPYGVTFPAPFNCTNAGLCVEFGAHTGGFDEPAEIPVILKGVFTDYEEIDVLIDVSFDNQGEMPEIIGNDIQADDIEVFSNSSGGYSIYAHARNIQHSGHLFTIKLNGPMFLSSGGTATLSLEEGRFEQSAGSCCAPCLGIDESVVFTGFPDCTEDITLLVNGHTQNKPNDCADSYLTVQLTWPTPPGNNTKDFYKFNVVLDLDMTSSVQILGISDNFLGCPPSDPLNSFCGNNDCLEISGNTIQYCFYTLYDEQSLSEGAGFRIDLDAGAGCVNGVTVREAYISQAEAAGPTVACVPNISIDQNDFPLCSPMISGKITDENNEDMESYSLLVEDNGACPDYNQSDNCTAEYAQCVCEIGNDWMITPSGNNDYLNGVTIYDLVLISRHILGVQLLSSPYKIIAADVNKSNTVTTFDIVEIRKVILYINEDFPSNTSWRFIPKSFVFTNPSNPFANNFPRANEKSFP